jgi:Flp pilus assembly secretin CpaC
MSIRLGLAALLCAAILAGAGTPALAAGDPVTVKVNMARILRISSPASTVIVGNPGVADVTIQDPQTLVLTGKSYGQTNLIVLDAEGNPIADTIVEVVQEQANLVTVYMGSKRTSVACAPVCQPIIMLGDDSEYATSSASTSQAISAMANGN